MIDNFELFRQAIIHSQNISLGAQFPPATGDLEISDTQVVPAFVARYECAVRGNSSWVRGCTMEHECGDVAERHALLTPTV